MPRSKRSISHCAGRHSMIVACGRQPLLHSLPSLRLADNVELLAPLRGMLADEPCLEIDRCLSFLLSTRQGFSEFGILLCRGRCACLRFRIRTMTNPDLSPLGNVVHSLKLEEVIPHLNLASDAQLQASFAAFLFHIELQAEFGILENFNPTTLPYVPFTTVENAANDTRPPEDNRSLLMRPYFTMVTHEEQMSLISHVKRGIAMREAPLDSRGFLACRVFFQLVAEAVEQGFRVVILHREENSVGLILHIKALRMLKMLPNTFQREQMETVLLQVEYYCGLTKDVLSVEQHSILSELVDLHPAGKTWRALGTESQICFALQVLRAHERLLEKAVISQHDKESNPMQNRLRPSFILPLRSISHCTSDYVTKILQDIKDSFIRAIERTPSCSAEPDIKHNSCAACGKMSVLFKVCARCNSVKYCTQACLVSDRRTHQQTCRVFGSNLN